MTQAALVKNRVQSIDVLRGIVMIIMAIDHVRDFFHVGAFQADPLDPATTTPMLYFTRWITHFCAPTFVFLAGTSSYLTGLRRTKAALSAFLIKRGLWLILVELLLISLALSFNPFYNAFFLQVIWAIGISMVLLGLAVWLPFKAIFAIGAVIVLFHNLFDPLEAAGQFKNNFFWDLLHGGRFSIYPYAVNRVIVIVYPFLPWTGIMLLGYCTGRLFEQGVSVLERRKALLFRGSVLILLFFVLRAINIYGDPSPWTKQDSLLRTCYSFFNVTKYPPSLMYTGITIGISLLVLAGLESVQNKVTEFARVFGRVPFFYYVLHFYLIHLLEVGAFFLSGYGAKDIVSNDVPFLFRPAAFGFPLWGVYLVWIGVILILYPLCRKYNRYKSTHHQWWLSYL